MVSVVCVNGACRECDVVKPCEVTLFPGEKVLCGECGRECQIK